MFWDSVIGGLEVLTFWETYVAGLVYLLIFMVPMALMGLTMKEGMAAGCVSMLVIPVFQAAAVAVFVLTLAPIIFGFAEDAAWSFPWVVISMLPGMFIKLVGTLVLSAIGVSFVPLIGQMRSLHTLVLGGIALLFVLKIFGSLYPEVDLGKLDLLPGFWFTSGLLIIGGLMAWVGTLAASILATVGSRNSEGTSMLLMFPVAAIFGFIPLFIYGAWIGNQLRNGL
ncbi:hypothetical protein ACSZOL_05310 [Aeromonas hydrophila]|uniref:hypothetical protein n=1 Tax=Aeromonas TaxID=642 RepID=UPI000FE2ED54|nr:MULTISPECIES: hypothetical protein [Aeromonas]MDD9227573.1 hypothetical protein [Aeromonas hydrophila]RWT08544.1 hypothetical protein DN600_02780 [Aeromonas caviae]WEA28862.1 hypothetical protein PWO56_16445 [Aeromonas hydrophila]